MSLKPTLLAGLAAAGILTLSIISSTYAASSRALGTAEVLNATTLVFCTDKAKTCHNFRDGFTTSNGGLCSRNEREATRQVIGKAYSASKPITGFRGFTPMLQNGVEVIYYRFVPCTYHNDGSWEGVLYVQDYISSPDPHFVQPFKWDGAFYLTEIPHHHE